MIILNNVYFLLIKNNIIAVLIALILSEFINGIKERKPINDIKYKALTSNNTNLILPYVISNNSNNDDIIKRKLEYVNYKPNKAEYNFCDIQSYEMDTNYKFMQGIQMYFYTENNSTLIILSIISIQDFKFKLSFYSNESKYKSLIEQNSLLFGFRFNTTNIIENAYIFNKTLDINDTNYSNTYKDVLEREEQTDVIVCWVGKEQARCSDYYYVHSKNDDYIYYYENINKVESKLIFK